MVLDHIEATISNSQIERLSTFDQIKSRITVTAVDVDGTKYTVDDYWLSDKGADKKYQFNTNDITKANEKRTIKITYCKNDGYYCYKNKDGEYYNYTYLDYTVIKNEDDLKIKSIEVRLTKKDYNVNELISGLTVTATYGYGNKETITTCLNDFDSKEAVKDKVLTVTCGTITNKDVKYSVKDNSVRKLTAELNKTDGKYTLDENIVLTVKYYDEYNVEHTLKTNEYEIKDSDNKKVELSTAKEGNFNYTVYKKNNGPQQSEFKAPISYTVNEVYLFDVEIVEDKLIQVTESYDDFIDISEIKVYYKPTNGYGNGKTQIFTRDQIEMVSYESSHLEGDTTVYVKPTYETDEFDKSKSTGTYRVPVKIEITYGKTKTLGSKYHRHQVTFTVSNGVATFAGHKDLNVDYNK